MNGLHAHFREIAVRLETLRNVFSSGKQGAKYEAFFDEYLQANDLELALHAVCDFLLDSTTRQPTDLALRTIESLHNLMELRDDCVAKLKEKS